MELTTFNLKDGSVHAVSPGILAALMAYIQKKNGLSGVEAEKNSRKGRSAK